MDTYEAGAYVSRNIPHSGVTTDLVTLDCGGGRFHLTAFDRYVDAWDQLPAGTRPATDAEIEAFKASARNFGWDGSRAPRTPTAPA